VLVAEVPHGWDTDESSSRGASLEWNSAFYLSVELERNYSHSAIQISTKEII